jgi:hypothetical protein
LTLPRGIGQANAAEEKVADVLGPIMGQHVEKRQRRLALG